MLAFRVVRINGQPIKEFENYVRIVDFSSIRKRKHCEFVAGTSIGSFRWNDKNPMLAGIADGKLNVWLYPNVAFIDPNLVEKTVHRIESRFDSMENQRACIAEYLPLFQ